MTVTRVRQQCVREGVDAALARKAPAREYVRKLDGEQEAHLIALTCSEPPEGQGRWSLRLLAKQLVALEYVETVSHEPVRQVARCNASLDRLGVHPLRFVPALQPRAGHRHVVQHERHIVLQAQRSVQAQAGRV